MRRGGAAVNVRRRDQCCLGAPASNAGWIAVSDTSTRSASASFSFSVAANAASTSRNGSIAVAGRTVAVSQAAAPALPNLSVSSSAVSLVAASGSSTPVSTTVAVSAGGASVPIAVSGNLPAWLTVGPASLQTPASLSIGANPAGLGAGTYAATVTLSSTATQNPSVSVAVAFTVRAPGKVLSSLRALSFHSDSTTVPPSQTLFVRDVAGVSNLTVSPGNTAWLSASQTLVSGTWQIVVRADPRGLADGIHDASLLLSCGALACDPGTIPVRLAVRNTAAGGPRIGSGGVVNAASFQQGMASGAWMSVFGANLASTSRSWRTSDFQGNRMPLALDGVQVFVGGQQAAIHFISPGQVNFQAPSGIPSGWVQVQISTPSGTDTAFVYASREAPGFFTFDSAGNLSALHSDGTPVGSATGGTAFPGRPAKPGEVLAIYGTGFGPTAPDVPSGRVFSGSAVLVSSNHLTVTIGGLPAEVRYAGLTGAGLNQINVVVPSLPRSTYEIVATAAGSPTQFSGRLIIE
ncbi:MAG: IPT/TIG domain-containing protein [Bryobacterales bacterium]|nr:IPT/TIG domain-containing protein [Bryobacterales bacterium]